MVVGLQKDVNVSFFPLRADPELLKAYVTRKREIITIGMIDCLDYCRTTGEYIKEVLE